MIKEKSYSAYILPIRDNKVALLRYGEDGVIHNPILTAKDIEFFNKWYENSEFAPELASMIEQKFTNINNTPSPVFVICDIYVTINTLILGIYAIIFSMNNTQESKMAEFKVALKAIIQKDEKMHKKQRGINV